MVSDRFAWDSIFTSSENKLQDKDICDYISEEKWIDRVERISHIFAAADDPSLEHLPTPSTWTTISSRTKTAYIRTESEM